MVQWVGAYHMDLESYHLSYTTWGLGSNAGWPANPLPLCSNAQATERRTVIIETGSGQRLTIELFFVKLCEEGRRAQTLIPYGV